jgi:hypothetical protein
MAGWFELIWIILGTIGALGFLVTSISYFADNRAGLGILFLILIPVAFVVAVFAAMLAVLAGIAWLAIAALTY